MKGDPDHDMLVRWLRHALRHLYDPLALRRSPLCRLLGGREPSPAALRSALVAAIEALKPRSGVSSQSGAWRTYHVLAQRYVQQFSQPEVATDLGLGVRQLQRQEQLALGELAEYLRVRHGLTGGALADSTLATGVVTEEPGGAGAGSRDQELAWLEKSFPSQPMTVAQVAQAALKAADALMASAGVQVECILPESLPRLDVQAVTVPQALLTLLTVGARSVPGGRLQIEAGAHPGRVWISVTGVKAEDGYPDPTDVGGGEDLDMARQLVALSKGTLEVAPATAAAPFAAMLILPAAERVAVLVIDDNADTLQ